MTKQEENWELMTILSIPWSESCKITDKKDREFLLEKADELKKAIIEQQKQQQEQILKERSSIISASDVKQGFVKS